jgi:TetR/AcrR family transcriptional repressor of nem operon
MSIGRPLQFDPNTALQSAMNVFWRQGYEASSLQDLISAMGLSKSSFYQAFESKQALFKRCIMFYRQGLVDELQGKLSKTDSGKAFIQTLFRDVAKETTGADGRRGCLLMNTASEFAQSDPEIAELVSRSIKNLTQVFELAIEQGQQQGDIPAEKNRRDLANYLVSSISGLKNMVKAGASSKSIKQTADIVLSALD